MQNMGTKELAMMEGEENTMPCVHDALYMAGHVTVVKTSAFGIGPGHA